MGRVDSGHGTPDAVSATELFELVYRQMASLTAGRTGDFDDLVQLAVEAAIRALPGFEGRSSLSTWTYGICYRTLLQHRRWYYRWRKRFSWTENGVVPEPVDATPDHLSRLEAQERIERLRAALQTLSNKRRTVVVLKDLEGRSVSEIAEITGTNELTVRSRLRDARKALLAALRSDPYFGEAPSTPGVQS